jgi:hypothetical protein
MLVVIVATATAFFAVALFGNEADPTAFEEPTPTIVIPVAVRELALRSTPDAAAAIVARLNTGDAVEITGRDATSEWLFVHPEGNPATEGWVPADGIEPVPPLEQIPVTMVFATPDITTSIAPTGVPTFTPDLPDLVIESVFSRDNQLTVVIANIGIVDAIGPTFVSVDGGTPVATDVKPGEPLRPNDHLEVVLATEYVQRRASVSVTVSTDPAMDEESLDNNTRKTIVTPDRPNDLAITSVTVEGPDASLRVTIRNESPIPITGSVTISARESSGNFTELGTLQPFFTLAPRETLELDFPGTSEVELDNVQVLMTTTAIDDADSANDIFPL